MFNLAGTTMKLWSFTAVILVEILVYPSCGNSQIHGSSAPFSNPNYGVLTGLSILGPRYENVDMLRRYENFLSGYDTTDFTGNRRWRNERRTPNGRVIGNYGILDRNGQVHIVDYITDENGYRAVEREREISYLNLINQILVIRISFHYHQILISKGPDHFQILLYILVLSLMKVLIFIQMLTSLKEMLIFILNLVRIHKFLSYNRIQNYSNQQGSINSITPFFHRQMILI
ncbi:uncharacterized protein LOC143223526 [Tachypleus tridentatus]|uniref:uncharacterized protein LOC143223526 n=1 Tax=Tachypleus tridentatus TaxID=6853 RepID=UPI003FD40ED8